MSKTTTASDLPVEIWTLILRQLPQSERLRRCSRVCSRLRAAAVAATDAVSVVYKQAPKWKCQRYINQLRRFEAFCGYLQLYGGNLTSLELETNLGSSAVLPQLPCARLLELKLTGDESKLLRLQLGPSSLPAGGVLGICTALTHLHLVSCEVSSTDNTPHPLVHLSSLVDLKHMMLLNVFSQGHASASPTFATFPASSILPRLPQLTHLCLRFVRFEELHHVSVLSSLSVLDICDWNGPEVVRLGSSNISPSFALPVSLVEVSLSGRFVVLDTAALSAATRLTRLELSTATVEGGESSGTAFLAALQGLQQLVDLEVESVALKWPQPVSGAYAALVGSPVLQRLACDGIDCGLPKGAWEHVFGGAVRTALTTLTVGDDYLGPQAARNLVRCCPNAVEVEVYVYAGPAMAELQPLVGSLTHLETLVCNELFGVDKISNLSASVSSIAALTNLRSLTLSMVNPHLMDRELALPLTALRALTCFSLESEAFFNCSNKAGPGQPPDVWKQLLEWCEQDSSDYYLSDDDYE